MPLRTPEEMGQNKLPKMTTQQIAWTKYTGSDEQLDEMYHAENGYMIRYGDKVTEILFERQYVEYTSYYVHSYWIIPADPLREIKIRQSQTGQPVWVRQSYYDPVEEHHGAKVFVTTTPDWNIPNAEYSFTPWED